MSGTPLLHNMSVPPRFTLRVTHPHLGGESFWVGPPKQWTGFDPSRPAQPEALERALEEDGIPDRIGVFVEGEAREESRLLSTLAAAAVLSRRSGPLYLPWRPIDPLLVRPTAFVLVFPEEGDLA